MIHAIEILEILLFPLPPPPPPFALTHTNQLPDKHDV